MSSRPMRMEAMTLWHVDDACLVPNGSRLNEYSTLFHVNVVNSREDSSSMTCRKAWDTSRVERNLLPDAKSRMSSMRGEESPSTCASLG